MGQGIALHEGQRFGWPNQLLALFATTALVLLSVSGLAMWWRRGRQIPKQSRRERSEFKLTSQRAIPLLAGITLLGIALPLFGLSLLGIVTIDQLRQRLFASRGTVNDLDPPELSMELRTIAVVVSLLVVSNVFMTFAWYGHLKNLAKSPWLVAVLVSWLIAFFEYLVQVPANRYGNEHHLSLGQLKILQEVVTLAVFIPFAVYYMNRPLSINFCGPRCACVGGLLCVQRLMIVIRVRLVAR